MADSYPDAGAGFPSAGTGALLGTNQQQQSTDQNTRAIEKLTDQVAKLAQAQGGSGSWISSKLRGNAQSFPAPQTSLIAQQESRRTRDTSFGSPSRDRSGSSTSFFPGVFNPFPTMGGIANQMALNNPMGPRSTVVNVPPFPKSFDPFATPQGAYSPVGSRTMQPYSGSLSYTPPVFGPQPPPAPSYGGPYNPKGRAGFAPGSAAFPPVKNPFARGGSMAGIAGGLGGISASISAYGKRTIGDQIIASSYVNQAFDAAPAGATFGQINAMSRYQAFGSNNRNLNGLAFNTQDAAAGQATQGYVAGYVPGTPMGQQGSAVLGATSAMGYINPGMGYRGASAFTGTMYSPQMSMQMRALGYQNTPRTLGGGGFQGMGQNVQSLLSGWYGSNKVNQKNLLATLSEGGIGTYNLQALGYNPQQISQMTPVIESYNKLFNKGVSANRANQLFTEAGKGDSSAENALKGYGIGKADIQAIKDKNAITTGRTSDVSSGFNAALNQSTSLLGQFNKVLTAILHDTGTTGALGYAGGIGGTFSSLTHGGSLALGAFSGFKLAKGVGKLFRGGGGEAAADAAAETSTGVAATTATAAGEATATGLAASIGGILSAALAPALAGALIARANPIGSTLTTGRENYMTSHIGAGLFNRQPNAGGGAAGLKPTPGGSQGSPKGSKQTVGGSVSGAAVHAVQSAEQELGKPYVWGGDSPSQGGFDCSGLVEWSYAQAGVHLLRTSEQQYAQLKDRRIPLKNVQEGDLVFATGGDGTPPGHVAMMANKHQIVEAQGTGIPIHIRDFNPHEWDYGAARPTGSTAGSGGPLGGAPINGTGSGTGTAVQGNSGMGAIASNGGFGLGGYESDVYNSGDEMSMLSGGFIGGGSVASSGGGTGIPKGGSPGAGGGNARGKKGATTANLKGNKRIMNNWAAKFGWGTGREWNSLNTLEMHEAGYDNTINNPHSTAYGMGQFLDSTWATVGGHKTSDPNLQAKYMMEYIKGRYGDPVKAWAQYYQHPGGIGWYGAGGHPGKGEYGVVGDRGPELVKFGEGGHVVDAGITSDLLNGMHAMVQQVGSSPASSSSMGGRGAVNLNFGPNSVVINCGGSHNDAADSARQFARALKRELRSEHIYHTIAEGEKN